DITGPTQVQLGQQATFTATTRGVDSWVWILPDGTYITDQDTVTLTARSSGAAELTLRARSPDGVALRVVHQIGVTERRGFAECRPVRHAKGAQRGDF